LSWSKSPRHYRLLGALWSVPELTEPSDRPRRLRAFARRRARPGCGRSPSRAFVCSACLKCCLVLMTLRDNSWSFLYCRVPFRSFPRPQRLRFRPSRYRISCRNSPVCLILIDTFCSVVRRRGTRRLVSIVRPNPVAARIMAD
jgi:hypothetical protein